MTSTLTDIELVAELQSNGSEAAFAEIMERYSHKVLSLAMRISRSEQDAEEILQDVFITVYRKISKFEGKSAFSSWLFRITANTAFMKLRKRKQTPASSLEELSPSARETVGSTEQCEHETSLGGVRVELRERLEAAVENLPEEYRAIFVLRDVDGLSNQEVSDMLGLSLAAVKSRLHRSRLILRKTLRSCYEEYCETTPPMAEMEEELLAA
jgi:RNA polymerase sigma-70 factor (ECF subfamily)